MSRYPSAPAAACSPDPGPRPRRVARLDDVNLSLGVGHHAEERDAVVEVIIRQEDEVVDGRRRLVGEQLHLHVALVGLDDGRVGLRRVDDEGWRRLVLLRVPRSGVRGGVFGVRRGSDDPRPTNTGITSAR